MSDVVTIDQIRDLIKAEKIRPSDLFGAEALTDDPAVKGYVETETRRAVAGEYSHRKRTEEGFDKTREDLEKKLKEKDAETQALRLEAAKMKVGGLFATQKEARKLEDRQVKFIEKRLAKFTPAKIEDLEKEFNSYLDTEIDEYGRLAKDVFGIDAGKPEPKPGDGGTGPENKPAPATDNKYLDPAQNPMIKLD